jgi:group I intron endonuclease
MAIMKFTITIFIIAYVLNSYILFKTGISFDSLYLTLTPLITYSDPAGSVKKIIIKSNKNKAGIYLWTNLITGESYVGRSIDLGRRFRYYFNINILTDAGNSRICRALLKYGFENFKLEIIEYTTEEEIVDREQFWISELKPIYNLVTVVDGNYTYTHTDESREKMSNSQKARFADPEQRKQLDDLHNSWAKSSDNISQLLEAQKNWFSKPENREKSLPFLKRKKVRVFDVQTKSETVYLSLTEAAKAMGCSRSTLNY